jgi:hypothetical protein
MRYGSPPSDHTPAPAPIRVAVISMEFVTPRFSIHAAAWASANSTLLAGSILGARWRAVEVGVTCATIRSVWR